MPRHSPDRIACAVLAAALLPSGIVRAAQVVDAQDGTPVEAVISLRQPTRIRIEGSTIREVFGNVQSSSCGNGAQTKPSTAAAPEAAADVLVECDQEKGEIYLRPLGGPDKPINLFVSSPQATYTLLLRPVDQPAHTVVLRDRSLPVAADGTSSAGGPSANPIRRLKWLLLAMASEPPPPDIRSETVNRVIPLWAQTRFTLLRRFEGRGLVGEQYALQNLGHEVIVLAEQEFDREGDRVAGVAIEHHNLRPGERTHVYVLRFGGAP